MHRPHLTLLNAPARALARLAAYVAAPFRAGLPAGTRAWLALRNLATLGAAGVLLLAGYALSLAPGTPPVERVFKAKHERPSVLLAADGSTLATFRRGHRVWIGLDQIPKHVVDALIATEDHRYWQHPGIDWRRTLSAVAHTLGGDRQGGSTLTQQLARNVFPEEIGRAPSATRKLKEMITALKLERAYSKRELLEAYFNTVSFHYNAFGLEMAARTYFAKPARELSLLEGATLVGLLKGTAYYNPVSNPARALERRNVVLAQMVKHGALSASQHDKLKRRALRLNFERQDQGEGPAPHFADAVRRWLQGWGETLGFDLYADGLVVQSTLDPRLQRLAQQAVERQLAALQAVADVEWSRPEARLLSASVEPYQQARRKAEPFAHFWASQPALAETFVRESPEYAALLDNGSSADEALAQLRADARYMAALRERKTRLEAGFVALDPRSGQVRAWVGSRDYALDSYDHVQQARRQPGSTFKPFVYGAALEAGIPREREFSARRVTIRLPDGQVWRPRDMGSTEADTVTLEDGLVHSRNGVTAQLIHEIGAEPVVRFARRMGVRESPLDAVPSLALGTSPVSLLEMASAYGTLAALGEYRAPVLVTRVSDAHGKLIAQIAPDAGAAPERVLQPEVALELIDLLRGAVERGTGRGLRAGFGVQADAAGKTGTTQNNTDGWFILMRPQLVAGAWVGFNDPRVTLRSNHWGQGGHNALRVVGDFTRAGLASGALDGQAEFPRPGNAIETFVRRAGDAIKRWFGLGSD